ncbi:coiled-coil and C2 domain-containing protein 1A [Denticeps clupeoides]|uniref:Coiled-coil and C2 domain-containing protein 1B n=1 Tax=Denticeps clupeoides TaxID=299321 RepID=A0AAY4A1B9_9TELE|nr:coiled-coil and C2 domain-containing protein 1A [Denticeps clupeoides]XP_028827906.1 coiled-coil and C2 domain-containing protein 1A [Denticeps clupeoides]
MNRSKNPPPRGQGAARAKQMGLLLDLDPDGGLDSAGNEEELEAELLALIGGGGEKRSPANKAGRAALPMEDIERMAALCMKDLDEEDGGDEGLEDDADLLAELDEVLAGDGEGRVHRALPVAPHITSSSPAGAGGLESRLLERVDMYQTAISNATAAGESSKARRYDRGLKTLQSMLSTVRKGKPINEEDIPPPVAVGGAKQAPAPQAQPIREQEEPPAYTPTADETPSKPQLPPAPQRNRVLTPDTPVISPVTPVQANAHHSELEILVTTRQRQYKQAAVRAKKSGETDLAVQHLLVVKKLGSVVEALDRGEPVDVGALPPPPGDPVVSRAGPQPAPAPSPTAAPPVAEAAPRSLEEALQQRMDKYRAVAEGSKTKGDDRKFRMHQRIVKQYQDAIRAHKAGRPVNLAELPVPPGCPPLQGSESGEQNFAGILDTAMKLANQDADAEEDSPDEDAAKPAVKAAAAQKPRAPAAPAASPPGGNSTATTPGTKLGPKAQQQLDFLEKRRQQFVKAALRSKQMKDMQGAAQHLRNAKGLDTMITAAKGGLPVDISKVPSAPVSEEDYSLSRSRASPLSPRASEQYSQLMDLLKKQHEKCLNYSQQFTHMGNVAETARFEKLAEECMKDIELLKKAHAKGCATPKYHTEERTFNTVRMNSNLTANDLQLIIVKGVNLPAPAGCSPGDLDASVRFEFPFPSAEEAQRDKTSTVKNTNCPEFKEQFKLSINRTHRSFKRVVQSKGIKFEVIHKGGLFKTDKVVGTAQLKLEALDNQCEIRDIIDVLDGRRPTGGKLEVRVKVREPLCGVQLQPVTEKWLVLDPVGLSPPGRERGGGPSPKSKPRSDHHSTHPSSPSPQFKLHSFSLLNYDKERLERKLGELRKNRREPPSDLLGQHKEVCQRLQWQKAYLERASPTVLAEYEHVLQRFVQGLSDSVKKFSSQGNRDAAKDALGRMRMVEQEIDSLKRRLV